MSTQTENQHLTIPEIGDTVHDSIAAFGENFQKLDAATVRVAAGTYVGTGGYGAENPTSLTFDFAPKVVFVRPYKYPNGGAAFYAGVTEQLYSMYFNSHYATLQPSWSEDGRTVSWYNTNLNDGYSEGQLNAGYTYAYLALG